MILIQLSFTFSAVEDESKESTKGSSPSLANVVAFAEPDCAVVRFLPDLMPPMVHPLESEMITSLPSGENSADCPFSVTSFLVPDGIRSVSNSGQAAPDLCH
jgi:hypothetical protein